MKLHIGCGKCHIPGWTNIDIFSNIKADMYASALALPIPRESVEIVYASHILEHFQRHLIVTALSHWRDLLIEGGILRLAVPDFEAIVAHYIHFHDLPTVMGLLYGGQDSLYNNHYATFDYYTLLDLLLKVGFKEVKTWDWKETEHAEYDDYSQAYLPHLDKAKGRLMSLNIEAIK
jgi:predicted SAM-dependent methyltransferase